MGSITILLHRWREGDRSALDELVAVVYPELRRIAEGHLHRDQDRYTLSPTALVHEAYLRLLDAEPSAAENRVHFCRVVSRVMRNILVDHARARQAGKRGGGMLVELEEGSAPAVEAQGLLAVDAAISRLADTQPGLAQIVEMRFFGGMTADEIAAAINCSVHTVRHDTRLAMAWLRKELTP